MRLSVRLTLVFGALGLVAISGMAVISWVLAAREVRASVDEELMERAELVRELTGRGAVLRASPNPPGPAPEALTDLDIGESGAGLYRADGTALVASVAPLDLEAAAEAAAGGRTVLSEVTTDDGRFRVAVVALEPGALPLELGFVQLYRETTDEEAALDRLARWLAAIAVISVLAVAAGSWFVGRWLARPLRELTAGATELAELDAPPGRIEIARGDEIGTLAHQFNRMLSALEIGREQQRRLVADASHELRTPLTSLRMRTEFLAVNDDLDPGERQRHLDTAVADVEQLSVLVGDLVDLAAEVRAGDERPERRPLGELVVDVARQAAQATGREVTVATDGAEAEVRPAMIRRAVRNLIDNADKYSPTDTPIEISARAGHIEVADRGEGIPPEDLRFVFDRFYRSPRARTRPGNGIGLAIVAQVAETHRGRTWARARPGGGTAVGFSVALDPGADAGSRPGGGVDPDR